MARAPGSLGGQSLRLLSRRHIFLTTTRAYRPYIIYIALLNLGFVAIFPSSKKQYTVKKYKTFSVLIYSYINTSGNWKNEKLCGNTTPAGRSVFTQFRVFPIFTSVDITVYQYGKNVLYFFYNIAQRTLTEEWREIFRVDIELYQHGS